MSDNPLGDWLRARGGDRDPDADGAGADPDHGEERGSGASASGPGGRGVWPGWERQEAPGGVPWDQPPEPDAARSRRLVALTVLPWVVVVVLGVLAAATLYPSGGPSGPQAGADAGAAPDPAPPERSGRASGEPTGPGAPRRRTGTAASRWPAERVLGAAAALAVRTADLSGHGERRYVDLALPEAVAWHGTTAVVTVSAVVLEGTAEAWHTVRPARFAVLVGLVDGRAVALGGPWALAAAEPVRAEGAWAAADVDHGDISRAAQAAGYADARVEAVDARPDLAAMARARVHARAPGEQRARVHELWLATDPAVAVLGAEGPSP